MLTPRTATPRSALALCVLVFCALSAAACADESAEPPAESGGCACDGGVCDPGQCTFEVIIQDECWGQARVFLNDLSDTAEPVGVASLDESFVFCEGFQAPGTGADGEATPGEEFSVLVESEDGRAISQTFTQACAGSAVVELRIQSCF